MSLNNLTEAVKKQTDAIKGNRKHFLPPIMYLGGAFFTANQPGMGFWDGLIWLWYVGRYVAQHFTVFAY